MSVRATTWAWEQGREHDLNNGELLLLVRIGDHADNDGICWPGTRHLADYCCCDESTIRRNLARLEDKKLIVRERQQGEGRGRDFDRILMQIPAQEQAGKTNGRAATKRAKAPASTVHSTPDQPGNGARVYVENPQEPSRTAPQPPEGGRERDRASFVAERDAWAAEHFPAYHPGVVGLAINAATRRPGSAGATPEAVQAELDRLPTEPMEAAA